MRKPGLDPSIASARRKILGEQIKGSALILAANSEYLRNNDVHYNYRQDSNFYYYTGFEEPESFFVFRPGMQPETVLFVRPKDPDKETWDGFRYGPDGAKREFQIDQTYSVEKLEDELPNLLADVEQVYHTMFVNRDYDQLILRTIEKVQWMKSRSNRGNLAIVDPRSIIGEMRLRKSEFEIDQLKHACDATSDAHIELMKATKPGVNERALHGVFIRAIMERGCAREGYGSIIASGNSATTLHYVFNDQPCRDGDMLLVDAGGEYNYYSSDITRTFPVNGKFNPAQKRVYQKVLDLQKRLVSMVRPGQTREGLQKEAISTLTEIMIDEKLLKGRKETIIEKKEYLKFYPHGVGHWLGMDVHDAGTTDVNGEPRPLEPGIVLTVEPGLYIPEDTPGIPEELRGIGIRIEDDVLVTDNGGLSLTAKCLKEIDELESVIGANYR